DLEIRHLDPFDRGGAGVADMVPHEIEPTKGVGCAPHNAAGEVVLAQIAYQAQRPGPPRGKFPPHPARPPAVHRRSPTPPPTPPAAAPSRANGRAPARPIPEAAPETIPILPSSRMVSSPSFAPFVPPPRERFRGGA